MKQLTEEEFNERTLAVLRANQIFIDSGVANNISIAFELYQKVCAEREREIFISTQVGGNRARTIMDRYIRPSCPECGADMMFRNIPDNPEGIKTQLVCTTVDCDTVLDSEMALDDWMKELKVKE